MYNMYMAFAAILTANTQRGVAHIYTVGRSATVVKLKVKCQFEISSIVNSQATISL